MFRVVVAYIDIAVHLVPQCVTGYRFSPLSRRYQYPNAFTAGNMSPSNRPLSPTASSSSGHSTPPLTIGANRVIAPVRHHRRRRTSGASFHSVGSITPIEDGLHSGNQRDSFAMVSSLNMDRDFEGVGGWRVTGKHADYDDAWAQLNSRLELPLDTQRRHHHRSPSGGGATTPGGTGDYLMMKSPRSTRSMDTSPDNANRRGRDRRDRDGIKVVTAVSPNSSRQRTPTNTAPPPLTAIDYIDGSYFPLVYSPQSTRRVH